MGKFVHKYSRRHRGIEALRPAVHCQAVFFTHIRNLVGYPIALVADYQHAFIPHRRKCLISVKMTAYQGETRLFKLCKFICKLALPYRDMVQAAHCGTQYLWAEGISTAAAKQYSCGAHCVGSTQYSTQIAGILHPVQHHDEASGIAFGGSGVLCADGGTYPLGCTGIRYALQHPACNGIHLCGGAA